tara:strand:- start:4568 stop:6757 length:2190 start_codon:yes stop_codon:yes gene_type:complete
MTIKKGLAVIDSNGVVTHKLMDDGEVVLGKTGAQFDLNGKVYLGANAQGLTAEQFGYGADLIEATYYNANAMHTKTVEVWNWKNSEIDDATAANIASYAAYVTNGTDAEATKMVTFESDYSDYNLNVHVPGLQTIEGNMDTLRAPVTAEVSAEAAANNTANAAMVSDTSAFNGVLGDFETVNAAALDVDTFQEIVDFIAQYDTTNDTALLADYNSLMTAISDEEAAEGLANTSLQNALNDVATDWTANVGTRETDVTTTNTHVTDEYADFQTHLLSGSANIESKRTTGDTSVQGLIDAEETARLAADGVLQTNIIAIENGESAASGVFSTALSVETSARIGEYDALSTSTSTMNSTQTSIKASLTSRLADQVTERQGDITALEGQLAQDKAAYSTHLSTNRSALTSTLSGAISLREEGDLSVLAEITAATTAANADEQTLSGSIDTEVSVRISVHSSLSTTISGIKDQLDTIINTDVDMDEFSEIVTYITDEMGEADSSNRIEISTQVSTLNSLIADEQSAQDTADGVLRSNLNAEKSSMDSALVSFTTRTTNYIASDVVAISTAVAADYVADKATFDASLANQKSTLMTNISDEEAAASTADSLIQDAIDLEVGNAATAVSNERTAQQNADTALSAQIDAFQASGFSGVNVMVTGNASLGNLSAAASATVKVGTLAAPPAIPANPADQNGMMFYLDMPSFSASGPFTENKKWYFCENGVWHMSPFYQE